MKMVVFNGRAMLRKPVINTPGFRWLMEGLAIDQPKAIQSSKEKKDF